MTLRRKVLLAATLGVVVSILVPIAVKAGMTGTIALQTDLTSYAWGSLADVRSSADSNEYIGCKYYANVNAALYEVECIAKTADNQIFYCSSRDEAMRSVAAGITANSEISFYGTNGGTCWYLEVDHFSYLRPMTP
jgi:hypothetical protein